MNLPEHVKGNPQQCRDSRPHDEHLHNGAIYCRGREPFGRYLIATYESLHVCLRCGAAVMDRDLHDGRCA